MKLTTAMVLAMAMALAMALAMTYELHLWVHSEVEERYNRLYTHNDGRIFSINILHF
jgi:hypothetical protein